MQLSGSQGLPEPRPSDPSTASGGAAAPAGTTRATGGGGTSSPAPASAGITATGTTRATAGGGTSSPAPGSANALPVGVTLLQIDSSESLPFEAGTVVQGCVLAHEGDDVTLQVGGRIVHASTPLPLAEGTVVDVEVRGQQRGHTILQVVGARLYAPLTERDLARAVKDMQLPVTEGNLQLARTMVEFGLPLTRGDMQQLLKLLGRLPGGNPLTRELASAACFLKAGQLPVSPQNLLALAAHLSRHPVLGTQILHLQAAYRRFVESGANTHLPAALAEKVAEIPRSMSRMAPDAGEGGPQVNPRDLARLAFQAGIEPRLPREPASPGSKSWMMSLLRRLEALEPQAEFPPEVARLQAALRQLAQEPGSQEHFVALQVAMRRLMEADLPHALSQALSTVPGMERLETVAWLRVLCRQLAAHPAPEPEVLALRQALDTLARALAEPRPPLLAPARQAWHGLVESPAFERLPGPLAQRVSKLDRLLAELERALPEGDSQRMRQDLLSLVGLPARGEASESATEDLDMVVFLGTLSGQLAAASDDSPEGAELRAALDNMVQDFVALRLLNAAVTAQGAWFLPIPLGLGNRTAQARIMCRIDRHGKPVIDAEDLQFEVVIPTEHLGNVCWRVRLKAGDLTLEVFLAEEKWRTHVEQALPRLTDRLHEAGYVVDDLTSQTRETSTADTEPRMLAPRKLESRARINLRI